MQRLLFELKTNKQMEGIMWHSQNSPKIRKHSVHMIGMRLNSHGYTWILNSHGYSILMDTQLNESVYCTNTGKLAYLVTLM